MFIWHIGGGISLPVEECHPLAANGGAGSLIGIFLFLAALERILLRLTCTAWNKLTGWE